MPGFRKVSSRMTGCGVLFEERGNADVFVQINAVVNSHSKKR